MAKEARAGHDICFIAFRENTELEKEKLCTQLNFVPANPAAAGCMEKSARDRDIPDTCNSTRLRTRKHAVRHVHAL